MFFLFDFFLHFYKSRGLSHYGAMCLYLSNDKTRIQLCHTNQLPHSFTCGAEAMFNESKNTFLYFLTNM